MLSFVSLSFSSIAFCSDVTKSASAVAVSNTFVENRRSIGFIGSLPRKMVLGQHPIEE